MDGYCDEHKMNCQSLEEINIFIREYREAREKDSKDLSEKRAAIWGRLNNTVSWRVFTWVLGFIILALAGAFGYSVATNSVTMNNTKDISKLEVVISGLAKTTELQIGTMTETNRTLARKLDEVIQIHLSPEQQRPVKGGY